MHSDTTNARPAMSRTFRSATERIVFRIIPPLCGYYPTLDTYVSLSAIETTLYAHLANAEAALRELTNLAADDRSEAVTAILCAYDRQRVALEH